MGYNYSVEVILLYDIRVEIAGVPFLIQSRFEEFRKFFRNYPSEKEPRFIICPTDADLEKVNENYKRAYEADCPSDGRLSELFLELNAIHGILAEKIVSENVLLIHGSALSFNGEAVVFTAKSGTGKSTHAKLWRDVFGGRIVMINDDKPFIRIEEGSVTVWGTPWNGKHHLSSNISAPLKAIVSLKRGAVNRIDPLSPAEAFPLLMESSYKSNDPASAVKIIEMEKKLLNAADYYALRCNMDPEAAHVCCGGIFGSDAANPKN